MKYQTNLKGAIQRLEECGGRLVTKNHGSLLWRVFAIIVRIVTLNGNKSFLDYYTTIGPFVCQPESSEHDYEPSRIAIIEHERTHIMQMKRWGLGSIWLGLLPFGIAYLLLPLPFGLAYFRWRFEREAYVHGIKVRLELVAPYDLRTRGAIQAGMKWAAIEHAVEQMTSGAYGYTWPFKESVRSYFEKELQDY